MQISRDRMRLVGREADSFLGASNGIRDDYSLVALLRATIIERTEWTIDSIRSGSTIFLGRVNTEREAKNTFGNAYAAISIIETRSPYFPDTLTVDGWQALDGKPSPVNMYMSQIQKTRIFVNESDRKVIAFVERVATNRWVRAFISVLGKILTWYFPNPLSAEDLEFFKKISISNKENSEEEVEGFIVDYVNKAAEKINFREMVLHKYLDGIANASREKQIREFRNEVESMTERINNVESDLSRYYSELEEAVVSLNAIENSPLSTSTEAFDFFNCHKCISVTGGYDDTIEFGITETLEYFDQSEFNKICENPSSYIHGINKDIYKVARAIFAENKGVFVVNAMFTLSAMKRIHMLQHQSCDDSAMPHPHIYFYGCAGGNDAYYSKYARTGQWQLAVEQAIGATKNVNFGDSTVCRKMFEWLSNNRRRKIIKVDGLDGLISVDEFLKILDKGEQ